MTENDDLYAHCSELLESPWVSDIHITVGDPLRTRTSGALERDARFGMVDDESMRVFLKKLRASLSDPETAIRSAESTRNDGGERNGIDFSAAVGAYRCRCNLAFANGGCLSLVMRRLSETVPPLASLGLPASIIKQITRPNGLVLVTGPTGSGKSTTLAAMLDHLNQTTSKHILTIEDPVEYLIKPAQCKITRKEIGTDAPSYLSALRAAVRQDPDIIMVGEARDAGTMRAALAAAETGHLVFATLHTNSAAKTVDRVVSFFTASEKDWASAVFGSVINCVISQTLVPRNNEPGRELACEVLVGTNAVQTLIKDSKLSQITNAIEQGAHEGHQSLARHLAELVAQKRISREAAIAHATNPDRLAEYLGRVGIR